MRSIQVISGFDVADAEIVKRMIAGDLVVTADIPLAAEVIAKGGERSESTRRALFPRYHTRSARHA